MTSVAVPASIVIYNKTDVGKARCSLLYRKPLAAQSQSGGLCYGIVSYLRPVYWHDDHGLQGARILFGAAIRVS